MYDNFRQIINEFCENEGYDVGFNGRSDGYIVMYAMAYDASRNSMVTYPRKPIDQDEDFYDEDSWAMEELKARCELVCAFDRACDRIRQEFLYWCAKSVIIEEEHTVVKTVRRLACPN